MFITPIATCRAFIQNRTDSWVLPSLYICTSISYTHLRTHFLGKKIMIINRKDKTPLSFPFALSIFLTFSLSIPPVTLNLSIPPVSLSFYPSISFYLCLILSLSLSFVSPSLCFVSLPFYSHSFFLFVSLSLSFFLPLLNYLSLILFSIYLFFLK